MGADWLETPYSLKNKRIWVAGHAGMVGRAICKRLKREGCGILTADHERLDLTRQDAAHSWLAENRPEVVVMAAGRVGGIQANMSQPAPFFYDNAMMAMNVIHGAYRAGVEKLLYLGSSCVYPRIDQRRIEESDLMSAPLEKTNEAYALSKIMGLKMCEFYRRQYGCDFISAMPCNLYGPYDHFDEENGHVIPALIKRFYTNMLADNSQLYIWGTGQVRREFMHVEDCADALVFLLNHYSSSEPVNVGYGEDVRIKTLAEYIQTISGFNGDLRFDEARPEGVQQKLLNSSNLFSAGWTPQIVLQDGLEKTWAWYVDSRSGE